MLEFIHAHSEAIIGGSVIVINAVLTRCPKVLENDIFQIVGNVAIKVLAPVFGFIVTKKEA